MPFDTMQTENTVTLNLLRGKKAIKRGWCKNAFRTRGRVCILGAIGFRGAVDEVFDTPEIKLLSKALPMKMHECPGASNLTSFNDHYATKIDVLALYDRAIALSQTREVSHAV